MSEKVKTRLESIERSHRRLKVWGGMLMVFLLGTVLAAATWEAVIKEQSQDRVVRARAVVIEDENGVVRARLGSDLPDAVSGGDTVERGTQAAGLMLYDKTGTERGGYVTFDSNNNVLLTLDSADERGRYRQTAYFVAEPNGATALRIWSGDDHVELRSGSDGGARFNAVRNGRLTWQMPELSQAERRSICTDLRELRDKLESDRVMAACRQRMTEDACSSCLEEGEP